MLRVPSFYLLLLPHKLACSATAPTQHPCNPQTHTLLRL